MTFTRAVRNLSVTVHGKLVCKGSLHELESGVEWYEWVEESRKGEGMVTVEAKGRA